MHRPPQALSFAGISRALSALAVGPLCWALLALPSAAAATDRYYDAAFRVDIKPPRTTARVELKLTGERLPSRIEFHIDPKRHRAFAAKEPLKIADTVVTWTPSGKEARITYDFIVDNERSPKRYDSLVKTDWAVFRADKMVPRMAVTSRKNLKGRTTLEFTLPADWTAASAYPQEGPIFKVDDGERRLDRPAGWILAGKLGKRSEIIKGIQTIVAAPSGDSARRQDILAFLNWNLPHLKDVFPRFPKRLLVVSAGDPMWRGGLSGPSSLFLHSERPLISENRTSTLLHELVHVAMGIRGDEESDWIAEGLAEFYSLEVLRRSGGIGRARYDEAIASMARWARESPSVFARESSGANTARAVIAFREVDAEIRQASDGRASLDDLADALARDRGEVNLELLQKEARKLAGRELDSLQRQHLSVALREKSSTPGAR
jgi:predicted metalloprotease with PDZ domain